jgi:hypothetical protein
VRNLILFVVAVAATMWAASCSSSNIGMESTATRAAASSPVNPGTGATDDRMNATPEWNAVCSQFNFRAKSDSTATLTFGQGYYGSNFSSDIAAIVARVNELQLASGGYPSVGIPPNIDDRMNFKIENWGR